MYKNTYYIKHCKAKISNCQVSFLLIKKYFNYHKIGDTINS